MCNEIQYSPIQFSQKQKSITSSPKIKSTIRAFATREVYADPHGRDLCSPRVGIRSLAESRESLCSFNIDAKGRRVEE